MDLLPFTDTSLNNAQCLVCCTSSLNSYVDLALVTSRTSHSETPVKEKVKNILNDKWIPSLSDRSFILCLSCFHLIDQFDSLETQLRVIQDELCNKYIDSHNVIQALVQSGEKFVLTQQDSDVQINGDRVKRAPPSKRHTPGRRKKSTSEYPTDELNLPSVQADDAKKDKQTETLLEWQSGSLTAYESSMCPGNQFLVTSLPPGSTLPMAWVDGDGASLRIVTVESNTTDSLVSEQVVDDPGLPATDDNLGQVDEEEDKTPSVVYDDSLEQFNSGERIRVGTAASPEAAPGAFNCCYCGNLFLDTTSLKLHIHSIHRPVVLTANLPPHLGLGPHANCGVHISNISVTSDYAKPFVCIFCDGAFKFKSNIYLHYKDKHTPNKPFSCQDCQESFRRSMELSRHRVYYCPFRKKSPGSDTKNGRT